MTYFYAQLFTMDTEIRAMFPAAMDVQRRRFVHALSRRAAPPAYPGDHRRGWSARCSCTKVKAGDPVVSGAPA